MFCKAVFEEDYLWIAFLKSTFHDFFLSITDAGRHKHDVFVVAISKPLPLGFDFLFGHFARALHLLFYWMVEQEAVAHDFNLRVAYCNVVINSEIVRLRPLEPQSVGIVFSVVAHLLELSCTLQNPVVIAFFP